MIPGPRGIAVLGSLAGLSGVVMAALGSHAVPAMDDPAVYQSWQSAVLIHLVHAAALLALAALAARRPSRLAAWAALLFTAGIVLFSGSLYLALLTANISLNVTAPLGGMALIAGWGLLAGHSLQT